MHLQGLEHDQQHFLDSMVAREGRGQVLDHATHKDAVLVVRFRWPDAEEHAFLGGTLQRPLLHALQRIRAPADLELQDIWRVAIL